MLITQLHAFSPGLLGSVLVLTQTFPVAILHACYHIGHPSNLQLASAHEDQLVVQKDVFVSDEDTLVAFLCFLLGAQAFDTQLHDVTYYFNVVSFYKFVTHH